MLMPGVYKTHSPLNRMQEYLPTPMSNSNYSHLLIEIRIYNSNIAELWQDWIYMQI